MPKNRYYHYDHETCSFVEVQPKRGKLYAQISIMTVGALILAGAFVLGLDHLTGTPQELALQAENEALQEQLTLTQDRIEAFSDQLANLSETDQEIYRTIFGAEPIPDDVRQVGVGGTDPYEQFDRFSTPTASLLRENAEALDLVERQLSLQGTSYRELTRYAKDRELALSQIPAIMPTDGPVVSSYGMRNHPILKIRRMHAGVDIAVNRGTPVYSTGDGVIKKLGRSKTGLGTHVIVEHPQAGYITVYGHLSTISDDIRVGRKVTRGDQLGLSGNTGLSKAPHLHYEVRDLQNRALNPIHFIAASMTPQQYKSLLEATENASISLD